MDHTPIYFATKIGLNYPEEPMARSPDLLIIVKDVFDCTTRAKDFALTLLVVEPAIFLFDLDFVPYGHDLISVIEPKPIVHPLFPR